MINSFRTNFRSVSSTSLSRESNDEGLNFHHKSEAKKEKKIKKERKKEAMLSHWNKKKRYDPKECLVEQIPTL